MCLVMAVMCDSVAVLWVAEVLGGPKCWTPTCNRGHVLFP